MIGIKQYFHKFAQLIPEDRLEIPKGSLEDNTFTDGLQIFFGIAAAVAVLIIAINALRIVISRGNSQDVAKARDAIIYASVGLVITMSGFIIVTFVLNRLS